jgi:hypothetical protein
VFTGTGDRYVQPGDPTYILPKLVHMRINSESTRSNPKWFGSGNGFMILNPRTREPNPFKKIVVFIISKQIMMKEVNKLLVKN